ncbi:MAG: hypothetical protein ABWY25_10300 [Paenisporosarcina sp.]
MPDNTVPREMTLAQYLLSTGVATSGELIAFRRQDLEGYGWLVNAAREQAKLEGIVIVERAAPGNK